MLIKRTERQAQRGNLAAFASQSDRSLDRRTFLRRSGLVAGSLGALGTLPLANVRRAEAGPPPPAGAQVTIRKSVCTGAGAWLAGGRSPKPWGRVRT